MTCDGELGLEAQEGALGGEVGGQLVGDAVPAEPVGDVAANGDRRGHHAIADALGLSADVLPDGANDVPGEGDGFLPDSEFADAG
jgi:hypothetical protein